MLREQVTGCYGRRWGRRSKRRHGQRQMVEQGGGRLRRWWVPRMTSMEVRDASGGRHGGRRSRAEGWTPA
ncbi:hypothetical protein U1Q18_018994 [Sarracenia purpurea var. burkii]